MELIIVTVALVGLAFWKRATFLMIVGALVSIAFGTWWITDNTGFIYVIEGVVLISIGIYMLIDTAIGLMRG